MTKSSSLKCTNLQKGCAHLWFRLLAIALNEAGYTIQKCIELGKLKAEISWNEDTIKHIFWEAYMSKHPERDGMAELYTDEFSSTVEDMIQGMHTMFPGIDVPFPEDPDREAAAKKKN